MSKKAGQEQLKHLNTEEVAELASLGVVISEQETPERGKMRIDLHCHSAGSHDSSTPLESIPPRCRARGINIQAITDHNVLWSALELKAMVEKEEDQRFPLHIIVGEEISTIEGELIGLFLEQPIPPRLSPEETVRAIKEQGGLVLLPHGFDPLKRFRLRPESLERIVRDVDIVETFNTRISRPRWNRAAVSWATSHGKLVSAGSDAHTLADVGSAWVEAPRLAIQGPKDLLEALKDGVPQGKWTHPALAYVYKLWDRGRYRFRAAVQHTRL